MFKDVIREQLKVPAHIDYLGELRDFVVRIGHKHGLSDKCINSYKLAMDEAGTNIIRHAYRGLDEPGFILIRVIIRKASVTVSLIDQGKYFDPRSLKAPDLDRYVEIGKKGGLGIFIIRKLMDEIDYRRTEEGNELRMTKYRDNRKKKGSQALPQAIQSIPLSLKGQYFFRAAIVFTVVFLCVYSYLFFKAGWDKKEEAFEHIAAIGQAAKKSVEVRAENELQNEIRQKDILRYTDYDVISAAIKASFEDNEKRIVDLFVVNDSEDLIVGHVDINQQGYIYGEEYPKIPSVVEQIADSIKSYTLTMTDENGLESSQEIIDFAVPIYYPDTGERFGSAHILVKKASIDADIASLRWAYLRLTLSVLLLTYVGMFVLIYILLNPFKKLATWIRAIDHGEVEDEMDIDSSTEIGEIAQAFSEMTTKFRQSQKNLAEQERLQKEMQVAQEIQQTLLPSEFPKMEGYEISAYYEAAKEVGGDYYDFVEVDKDTLGVVVADVSGKGVPGSLVMTMIRTALRTEARGVHDAAEVLAKVNDFVAGDMKKGMFVTVFYVIINSKRRRLNYASAGHNPMVLYRPSSQKTYYLNPKGFPIGIQLAEKDLFRNSIESDTIQLAEDDILMLYTDGITEAMNGSRELFGEERLLKIIREKGELPVKTFVEELRLDLQNFTEGNVQYDDITCVTIKEETTIEKEELRRAKLVHREIQSGVSIREACEKAGLTTYAYYNKYKKTFEENGVDSYEIEEEISLEAKHISIEDKTKLFDIIKNHPEFGAKRISEELNTEKYSFTDISEKKIYDELVRSRLNTKQLREAFVTRGGKNRGRIKPPGTPMLTLDGRIIIERDQQEKSPLPSLSKQDKKKSEDDEIRTEVNIPTEKPPKKEDTSTFDDDMFDDMLSETDEKVETSKEQDEENLSFLEILEGGKSEAESEPDEQDGSEKSEQAEVQETTASTDMDAIENIQDESEETEETDVIDDLLEQEISNSFSDVGSSVLLEDDATVEMDQPDYEEQTDKSEADENASEIETADLSIYQDDEESEEVSETEDTRVFHDETMELIAGGGVIGEEESGFDFVSTDDHAETGTVLMEEPVGNGETHKYNKAEKKHDDTSIFIELFSAANDAEPDNADMLPMFSDPQHVFAKKNRGSHIKIRPDAKHGSRSAKDKKREAKDKEILLVEGLRSYKKKDFLNAIDKFKNAIKKYPDFKEAHSILGNAYFRTNHLNEALDAYLQVLSLDDTDTTARENIGVIYANRGDFSKAVDQWKKILKIDPTRTDIKLKINKALDLIGNN